MIDVYCERTGPGLFAEPLNAVSNAAFLIAAWAACLLAKRSSGPSPGVQVLLVLSASVGVGSGLWHTLATSWAMALDVVPILLFLVCLFWLYMRSIARMPVPLALALIGAFLITTVVAQQFGSILNGALSYTPALIFLLVLGVFYAPERDGARRALLAAAGVYATALVFRTLDQEVCPAFPIGTHFLWHLLNGLAAYLAMRCLILNRAPRARREV